MATATVTINITFQQLVLADIDTYWRGKVSGTCGTLTADVAADDTILNVSNAPANLVGSSVIIDGEPALVAAQTGGALTVTRGPSAFPLATPAAHLTGAQVGILQYPTAFALISAEALRPWAMGVVSQLGQQGKSTTLSATATGSVAMGS